MTDDNPIQLLKHRLIKEILSGTHPPGSKFHSVRTLATWPDSNRYVAQSVLKILCQEGYLQSIPKKGLFVRDPATRQRPQAREGWHTILIPIPSDSSPRALPLILTLLYDVLLGKPWRVELMNVDPNYESNGGFSFIEQLLARKPSAILWLFPAPNTMLMLRYLVARGIPVVTYNRDFRSTGAMGVVADVSNVVPKLLNQLLDPSRKRLAILYVNRPSPSIAQFVQLSHQLASQRGLTDVRQVQLPFSGPDRPSPQAAELIDHMMTSSRPDAIICADTTSTLSLESWLASHPDIRIPQDLAVAAFDRLDRAGSIRLLPPDVPNAEMDYRGMMVTAMEMIETELAGRLVDPPVRHVPCLLLSPAAPSNEPTAPQPVVMQSQT